MLGHHHRVLPGFRLSLGYTMLILGGLLILPLVAVLMQVSQLTSEEFLRAVWTERARAAYFVTISTSFAAAVIDTALGLLLAWVLVRYEFPGRRLFDSLIDLPFALPTAVAGLVYSALYVESGWYGRFLVPLGIQGSYSWLAIVLVLTFIGLPFVVRAVQPVLETIDADIEEAAESLGATRGQTFLKVVLPTLTPALLTGFVLTFARGLGEYGSVVFVSGNMPFKTEIAPVLIVSRLEEFAYAEATAIALVLLTGSFAMLAVINGLERWSRRYEG
jgi:sulfate transport system permease protein